MPNYDYKNRYHNQVEQSIRDIKEELDKESGIKNRLRKVEQKAHVHNGAKKYKDLPKPWRDVDVIKTFLMLIIVIIAASVLWTTGQNILAGWL